MWFHLDNLLLVILVPQTDQNTPLLRIIWEYIVCSCEPHSERWNRRWAKLGFMSTSGILYPAVSNPNRVNSFFQDIHVTQVDACRLFVELLYGIEHISCLL